MTRDPGDGDRDDAADADTGHATASGSAGGGASGRPTRTGDESGYRDVRSRTYAVICVW